MDYRLYAVEKNGEIPKDALNIAKMLGINKEIIDGAQKIHKVRREKRMKSKLNLDRKVVDSARQHAANIAHDMQDFIDRHTTVSTERTIVRLLGVDGVDDVDTPLPNVVVDHLKDAGALPTGAAYWMGNAIVQTGKSTAGNRRRNRKEASWISLSFLPARRKKPQKH